MPLATVNTQQIENNEFADLPRFMQIEPVGQCNLRCQMCPIQFRTDGPPHGPPAIMSYETFTRLVDSFPTLTELHLQGLGEPLMHPRFFDMVTYAVKKDITVSTNTNLTLLNKRRAERCVRSGLHTIHISLDAVTAQIYERIRVLARFERVVSNLQTLISTRTQFNSDTPYIRLVMVIMRQNLHELPELVRFAHRWSINSIFVQHLCHDFGESSLPAHYKPMRDFVNEQNLVDEDQQLINRYFGEARILAKTLNIDLRLPNIRFKAYPPDTPGSQRCDWPWKGPYVSYDGSAMPCCMVATPDRINFGNMTKDSALQTWNNAAYRAFRKQLNSDTPPEICRSCSVYCGTF